MRAPLSRPATSVQRLSAVSSIGCSTRPAPAPSSTTASAEHSNVHRAVQWPLLGTGARSETGDLQGFPPLPHHSPQVWKEGLERGTGRAENTLCARPFSVPVLHSRPVENSCEKPCLYWLSAARPAAFFLLRRPREADLPAQRSPAETQARLPRPNVDPGGAPDSQAASSQGPETALRLTRAGPGIAGSCSAATASHARGTLMRSTGTAARFRLAFSSCTGSRVTTTASRGWG